MEPSFSSSLKDFVRNSLSDYALMQVTSNYRRIRLGMTPRWVNIRNPSRFTEKILWMKRYHRMENASVLADKVAVRDYVSERVGDDVLVPLAGVYERPDDIRISDLPPAFVIKPNHASGYVLFGQRGTADLSDITCVCGKWLDIDYAVASREYQYKGIPRNLVVELDMRSITRTEDIPDYKFFCFDGEPVFVQIDIGRFSKHRRDFYDMKWRRQPFELLHPGSGKVFPRPEKFERMKEIASRLSQGMSFIRVDLYDIKGDIYFGELTFHPDGGYGPFMPDRYDNEFGKLLTLPKTADR